MKYEVIALYGWCPSRGETIGGRISQRQVAVCKSFEHALEVSREVMERETDPSVPEWENPYCAIRPTDVKLPGFE